MAYSCCFPSWATLLCEYGTWPPRQREMKWCQCVMSWWSTCHWQNVVSVWNALKMWWRAKFKTVFQCARPSVWFVFYYFCFEQELHLYVGICVEHGNRRNYCPRHNIWINRGNAWTVFIGRGEITVNLPETNVFTQGNGWLMVGQFSCFVYNRDSFAGVTVWISQ